MAACQYNTQVKILKTDNAQELTSRWFEDGLAKLGVKHKLSIAYIHKTNGIAERFNRTVTASARALLFDSGLPLSLWGEVLTHAIYIKNRMPHVSLGNKSPHEVLTGEIPDLGYLQPFGASARVFILQEKCKTGGKLLARSVGGFLVGCGCQRDRYHFWIPTLHRIVISRDFKARMVVPHPEVITVETASAEQLTDSLAAEALSVPGPALAPVTQISPSMTEFCDRHPNLF